MRITTPNKYPLADTFLKLLKDSAEQINGELYAVYLHIFALQDIEELEEILAYYKSVFKGKDQYYKAHGKTQWFPAFHKAIRQCDYFQHTYRRGKIEVLTSLEKKEYYYLQDFVHNDGYDKTGKDGALFNDQYRRFLQLAEKKRAENRDKNIGGHLDMILYHVIHADKKNILMNTLITLFKTKQ